MKRKAVGSFFRTAKKVATGISAGFKGARKISQFFKKVKKRTDNRSKTKTKKFGPGVVQSTGHGISKSYSRLKYKPMKGLNWVSKTSNLDIFRTVNTNVFLSGTGRQEAHVGVTLNAQRLKQLMIECQQTNSNALAAFGQTTNDISREFWLLSYQSKCTYTNQGPNTIQMNIYDLMYKNDVGYNSILAQDNPTEVWQRGLKQEAGIDVANEFTDWSSSRPEDCKLFRQKFRILKKTEIEMHTGANHDHTFTFNYNGKVPVNKIEEMQGFTSQGLRGISYVRMIVLRGMPTDDNATWSDTGKVTRARAKVIAIDEQIYKTRLTTAKGRHVSYNNLLEMAATNTYNQNPDGQGIADTVGNVIDALKAFS